MDFICLSRQDPPFSASGWLSSLSDQQCNQSETEEEPLTHDRYLTLQHFVLHFLDFHSTDDFDGRLDVCCREKMICRILLLIRLSCVCGTFVVNVAQTSYQAEENQDITLEWMFTTTTGTSPNSIYIYCEMNTDHKASVLFHLYGGVEVPESRDQQFVGRVQWDKDVFRDGRLRLHVSRLRTEDSGRYLCEVSTNSGVDFGDCRLDVSEPKSVQTTTETPLLPRTFQTPEPKNETTVKGGRSHLAMVTAVVFCSLLILVGGVAGYLHRHGCQKPKFLKNDDQSNLPPV
ncbi:uncharacterized protein [Pagrus major]|uniref:uncharacterized protein n=1 Tax=Pagrus major TaxID=143350 RepID=UPI003CC8A082